MLGKSSHSDIWWNTKEEITSKPVLKSVCVGGIHMHTHTHTLSTHIMAWVFLLSPKWGSHSLSIPGTQSYTEEHEGLPVKHFNHLASYKHSNLLLHQIPGLWKSFGGKPNLLQGGIQMVYTNMWTYQLCATCSIKKINWQNEKAGGREREAGQLVKWRTRSEA